MNFRTIAETCRVALAWPSKKYQLVSNLLAHSKDNYWDVVYFIYPVSDSIKRLSDEDLREVYYLLTDLYPEELDPDPNLIELLCKLSNGSQTTAHLMRVKDTIQRVLNSESNVERASLLRPLFNRITERDMHWLFLRISQRQFPFKRHDVLKGIARREGLLLTNVKRASNLLGLKKVCRRLQRGEGLSDVLRPAIGTGMVISTPLLVDHEEIPFGKCFLDVPEGEWMTLHVFDQGAKLFNSIGKELETDENFDQEISAMGLWNGIFLIEYAEGRALEYKIVDVLSEDHKMTFEKRREMICEHLSVHFLKDMTLIEDVAYHVENVGFENVTLLWNAKGLLSFDNSVYEVAIVNPKKAMTSIFKVVGGIYTKKDPLAAPRITKWKIAVRDGNGFYEVGYADSEPSLDLRRFCDPHKVREGEQVSIKTPLYVEVSVVSGGWGEYGAYVQGVIKRIASEAGSSDCVNINQIESLYDGWDKDDMGSTDGGMG